MRKDHIRSIRMNELLQMALQGKNLEQIKNKIRKWNVTAKTEREYLQELFDFFDKKRS